MRQFHRLTPAVALFLGFAFAPAIRAGDKEDGFTPLFNGKDLKAFKFVPNNKTAIWTVKDGVIQCKGKPNGYFYTAKSYSNYILKLEFQYPEKAGNSGYLIHIVGKHKVWPQCVEVQGQYNGVCSIFPIGGAKGQRPKVDSKTREKVRKPHKEWNEVTIVCKDGKITSYLNGAKICESTEPYSVKEGPIGFQSEGAPINFRKLRIKTTD